MKRLIILILLVGCVAPLNPVTVLQDASTKQADYAAEFQTQLITTIDGQPLENAFRTTILKSGANKKTSVFVNNIGLISELYERGDEKTLCTYDRNSAVQCVPLEKKTFDVSGILPLLDETGLFAFTAAKSKVDERPCSRVTARFNPDGATPQGLDRLAELLGIAGESAGAFPLMAMDVSACFDEQTGLALETKSDATYIIQGTPLRIERSERVTSLTPPLATEETFRMPEAAS